METGTKRFGVEFRRGEIARVQAETEDQAVALAAAECGVPAGDVKFTWAIDHRWDEDGYPRGKVRCLYCRTHGQEGMKCDHAPAATGKPISPRG